VRILFAVVLFFSLVGGARAQSMLDNERFYGSLNLGWQNVSLAEIAYQPGLVSVAAGYWILPGIGFEAEVGRGYSDKTFNNLSLDLTSQASLNLRLESPRAAGYSAYMVFGIGRTAIQSSYDDQSSADLTTSLSGPRFGIGLIVHLSRRVAVDAGYNRYAYDDNAGVNQIRLGVRLTPGARR